MLALLATSAGVLDVSEIGMAKLSGDSMGGVIQAGAAAIDLVQASGRQIPDREDFDREDPDREASALMEIGQQIVETRADEPGEGKDAGRQPFRTVQARATADSLIKPGELVDLVEVTPLTLTDRRNYNMLLENAWDAIERNVTHSIAKSRLRGSHAGTERVGESIERLMRAIVKIRVRQGGETIIERVQLLGGNAEHQSTHGMLHYEIPPRLRRIISNSTIFARLQKEVMLAVSSKYALTLYEMVQKRGNLSYLSSEDFSLAEIRGVLGVPKGKLERWSNLYNRAIAPASREVSELSDYLVEFQPIKKGRVVTGVRLSWQRKRGRKLAGAVYGVLPPESGSRESRLYEGGARGDRTKLEASNGEARRDGQGLLPLAPPRNRQAPDGAADERQSEQHPHGWLLKSKTYESARLRHCGYDIYHVEREWLEWSRGKEPPRDPDKAFLAFFGAYAANHPL